ncbi:MAG: MATE family efflux transporter [Lachnospiraceae bacterium]
MEQNKKYEIDMCSGSVLKKMLLFALPLMLSSVLQLLFNAADIVVVGNFAGDNSMAAVGATGAVVNLLTNLFIGLSIGTNVLTARYYGSKQEEELKDTVHTSVLLSIVCGIFLTVVGVAGVKYILTWMSTPKEVLNLAIIYLRIYFLGMTAMMVYNFGAAILRAVGDTRRPLNYLLIAGVINVLLNLLFVVVLHMDVAGVALATVISQCISAFLVIRCLMREKDGIRLELKRLRIDTGKLGKITRIGLPAGFQGCLFSLSNVVIQSAINSFGAIVVAGNSAAGNIEGFVYVSMNTFYQAAISFVSQNMGGNNYKRINRIAVTALGLVIFVGVGMGSLVCYFGRTLLSIYTDSPEVIEAGMERILVVVRFYALCGMMDVMVGLIRGLGYSVMPMIVSLLGACVSRLVYIRTVFRLTEFHTTKMLYWSYPASWLLTFTVHVICFLVVKRKLFTGRNGIDK